MRTKKIKHIGKWPNRTKGRDFHAQLEKAFMDGWEAANKTDTILGYLLGDGRSSVAPTQEQAELAASVVQWMGSPVGFSFMREILKSVDVTVHIKQGR